MAVVTQPNHIQYREWNDGLFACGNDCSDSALTFFCYYCRLCCLAKKYGECCGTPIVIPLFELVLGTQHRARQRIRGSICKDFCQVAFCAPCYTCRLSRDIKYTELRNGSLE